MCDMEQVKPSVHFQKQYSFNSKMYGFIISFCGILYFIRKFMGTGWMKHCHEKHKFLPKTKINNNNKSTNEKSFHFRCVSFDVLSFVYFLFRFFRFCAWLHRIHTRWNFQDSNVLHAKHDIYDLRWWNKIIANDYIFYLYMIACIVQHHHTIRHHTHTHTHIGQYVQIIINNKQKKNSHKICRIEHTHNGWPSDRLGI